jgi:hypothetical protein
MKNPRTIRARRVPEERPSEERRLPPPPRRRMRRKTTLDPGVHVPAGWLEGHRHGEAAGR